MKRWLPNHLFHLQGPSLKVGKWLFIAIISITLIVFVYPSAFYYTKDTLPDSNDTRLIAYIIGQVQQNLLERQPLHYGTYFAPDQNTLAYSDLFLTSAVLTLPFRLFISSPIYIFNLALVLGFLLTILSSFLLFDYLFKDRWITTLTVLLFNFSGFHLHYLPHLQMFSLWPLLLSLYFCLRFQKENRPFFLTLFFFTVTIQLAESIFPVYLIFFSVLFLFLSSPSRPTRTILVGRAIPFIPFWIFLLSPYYHLHASLPEATRPISDAAHFSLGLDQIFTQFHGWTVIIIFLISGAVRILLGNYPQEQKRGIFLLKKNFCDEAKTAAKRWLSGLRFPKKNTGESHEKKWQYIFLFSIIMSLGPVLKIFGSNLRIFGFPIPLPYTLFYYLFPGFTGFRTPSRFIILALLAAVILVGYHLKPIFSKLKPKTKLVFLLLVLSLLLAEAYLPLKAYPVNINMHPVYQEIKALPPEAVILELPIKLWNMPDHEIESIRSLYSLVHRHRRFGGFSGFATNNWVNLVEKINAHGLDSKNIARLKSLGVTHVIQNNILSPLPH